MCVVIFKTMDYFDRRKSRNGVFGSNTNLMWFLVLNIQNYFLYWLLLFQMRIYCIRIILTNEIRIKKNRTEDYLVHSIFCFGEKRALISRLFPICSNQYVSFVILRFHWEISVRIVPIANCSIWMIENKLRSAHITETDMIWWMNDWPRIVMGNVFWRNCYFSM